jgi:hypothetical protein
MGKKRLIRNPNQDMENWDIKITNTIDGKLKDVREKDIRFYRIDEFKRNISRIEMNSKSCPFCKKQKINISEISNKIEDAVNIPGKTRREYDRLISLLSKHMQKEHGFYAPYYFSYFHSFWGIVAGLVVGYGLMRIFPEYWIEMLSIGFVSGLIPSYIWGHIKDKKIRSEKRLM